ncbi:MAG: His/Gly/Thr/Pro-type tRNA ligase C-terminal domain-containing protein, partial [Vicingaceae bacterium]
VIVPIHKGEEQLAQISEKVKGIKSLLEAKGISVKFDNRDTYKPGYKFAEWEFKGVPVRIAMGPRDLENGTVEIARRDTKEKTSHNIEGVADIIEALLTDIQDNLYNKALNYRNEHITEANSWDEFKDLLENKTGFISAHWDGTEETEEKIKQETKATIRCIPLDAKDEVGICVFSGNSSTKRVLFAKAY